MDELRDVYQHFMLYYGSDIQKMKNALKEKRRQRRQEMEGEDGQDEPEDELPGDQLKQASRQTTYTMCKQYGLCEYITYHNPPCRAHIISRSLCDNPVQTRCSGYS